MNKMFVCFVLAVLLSACASPATPQVEISQSDLLSTALAGVQQTQTVMAINAITEVTATPFFTDTPLPPTERAQTGNEYSWNYLSSIDSGGVVITIGRVVVANKKYLPIDFSDAVIYDDKPVLAEIIFVIENKTSGIVSVYPNQGKVLVGSEQIEMFPFAMDGGDIEGVYNGDVLPGAKLIGGLWVGFQRTSLEEINSMTIFISAPHNPNYETLGPDYNFNLDLSQKQFVEYPEELR